jgi:hypothetical protein
VEETPHRIFGWLLIRFFEVVIIGLCFQAWSAIAPDGEISNSLFKETRLLIFASIFFQILSGYVVSTFIFCLGSRSFSIFRTVTVSVAIYLLHFGVFYLLIARGFVWEVTEFSFCAGLVASFIGAFATYRLKLRFSAAPSTS